jgi:hypothetical protein
VLLIFVVLVPVDQMNTGSGSGQAAGNQLIEYVTKAIVQT